MTMQRDARGRFLKRQAQPALDRAYRDSRQALLDCLHDGCVDADDLRTMQAAMAPNREALGADRYDELRGLLDEVETLRVCPASASDQSPAARVASPRAYPYQFKWDGVWLFVLFLFAGGFAFKPLWVLAGIIAFMRCVVWLSFRFPLTMIFFTAFFSGLLGGRGRGRRW